MFTVTGETSSLECAHQLGKLCENRQLVVNLIPYNATDVKDKLQCPPLEHVQKFRDIVASYGVFCTIRRTMGADIASACGQLVQKTQEKDVSADTGAATVDIEDIVAGVPGTAAKVNNAQRQTDASNQVVTPPRNAESSPTMASWLDSVSTEELDRWANGLAVAAAISASCFVALSVSVMRRR